MVILDDLPQLPAANQRAYRLVNSKFPPIALFDDVADPDEFAALYEIQALTNPRLLNEAGNLELISTDEIPFDIPGCSYAVAPFTHVNPDGSRFSDGSFGVLYLADTLETAIAEVRHHQETYWQNVPDLNYERFVFRGLVCDFAETAIVDATVIPQDDPIYSPDDYTVSRQFGQAIKNVPLPGVRYHSVRMPGATCWGLMTPRPVTSIIQTAHYEMVWSGRVIGVNEITGV